MQVQRGISVSPNTRASSTGILTHTRTAFVTPPSMRSPEEATVPGVYSLHTEGKSPAVVCTAIVATLCLLLYGAGRLQAMNEQRPGDLPSQNLGLLKNPQAEERVMQAIVARLDQTPGKPVSVTWQEREGAFVIECGVRYTPTQSLMEARVGPYWYDLPGITPAGIAYTLRSGRETSFAQAAAISFRLQQRHEGR